MFRLVFMAFHGTRKGGSDVHHHLHDAPPAMAIPLIVLALGSILAGYVGVPAVIGGANRLEHFLAPSFHAAGVQAPDAANASDSDAQESAELMLMGLASLLSLAGIGLAARTYLRDPDRAARLAGRFPGVYRFLLNKGYVDELYNDAL